MVVIMSMLMSMIMMMVVVVSVVVVARQFQGQQHDPHYGIGSTFQHQLVLSLIQVISPTPFERKIALQEIAIHGHTLIEIEGMDVQDCIHTQSGLGGSVNLGQPIDAPQPGFKRIDLRRCDQIDLVEQNAISKGDLFFGFRGIIQMQTYMFDVHQGDDAIQAEGFLHVIIAEEGLGHGTRVGQTRGFDQNVVELIPTLEELTEDADEITADGAADAPVVHLEDFLVGIDDQCVVDTDLAKLIFDHRNALAMIGGEEVVEERGFASS